MQLQVPAWLLGIHELFLLKAASRQPCLWGLNCTGPVFSYKLRYIVGFWLVEIAISTNQKPTIYRNLYENTARIASFGAIWLQADPSSGDQAISHYLWAIQRNTRRWRKVGSVSCRPFRNRATAGPTPISDFDRPLIYDPNWSYLMALYMRLRNTVEGRPAMNGNAKLENYAMHEREKRCPFCGSRKIHQRGLAGGPGALLTSDAE